MKIIRTLKLFSALVFVALLSLSFTQNEVNDRGDWILLSTQSEINGYVMQSDCDGKSLFLFKFENTSDSELTISYTMTAVDDPTIPPITKSLTLEGRQVKEGTCDDLWIMALPNSIKSERSLNGQVTVSLIINK